MKPSLKIILLILVSLSSCAVAQAQEETEPGDSALLFVEQMPEYPGGWNEMYKFISMNTVYPAEAIKKRIEGKCVVTFIVSITGELTDFDVPGKKLGYGLDEEAMRIVKLMPAWKPGKQNGKAVPVKFTLPIKFQLN